MKANRTLRGSRNDERAEVGIGTLIVFIAAILVAAVASAVVIDTSNSLQEKAQRTGAEATEQVASNLNPIRVTGKIFTANSALIDAINITMEVGPGAEPIDLSQVIIRLSNGTVERRLNHSALVFPLTGFAVSEIRDPRNTVNLTNPVLEPGALVSININLTAAANDMLLPTRTAVELEFQPEIGAPVAMNFRTPAAFGTGKIFTLR